MLIHRILVKYGMQTLRFCFDLWQRKIPRNLQRVRVLLRKMSNYKLK